MTRTVFGGLTTSFSAARNVAYGQNSASLGCCAKRHARKLPRLARGGRALISKRECVAAQTKYGAAEERQLRAHAITRAPGRKGGLVHGPAAATCSSKDLAHALICKIGPHHAQHGAEPPCAHATRALGVENTKGKRKRLAAALALRARTRALLALVEKGKRNEKGAAPCRAQNPNPIKLMFLTLWTLLNSLIGESQNRVRAS